MLGLLGAALAGAGQVAALHSVREGVGFSFLLGRFLLLLFSLFVFFFFSFLGFSGSSLIIITSILYLPRPSQKTNLFLYFYSNSQTSITCFGFRPDHMVSDY